MGANKEENSNEDQDEGYELRSRTPQKKKKKEKAAPKKKAVKKKMGDHNTQQILRGW